MIESRDSGAKGLGHSFGGIPMLTGMLNSGSDACGPRSDAY